MAGDYTVFIRDDLGCTTELMATVDIETSVHTTTFGQMITVFPNPSQGVFRVNLEGLQRGDVFLPIQIYNNAGQLVQASQLVRYDQAYTGQISLVAEPDGVYFIRFLDDQIDRMLQVVKQ